MGMVSRYDPMGFSLVSSLLTLSLLKCIIPAVILYYLWVNQKLFGISVKL